MTTHPPQFETIFYPDGTCGVFDGVSDCHKPGAVLAQEVFSPFNDAMWFCTLHWPEFERLYNIVEDRRPLVLFFQSAADVAAMKIVEQIYHYLHADDEEDRISDEEMERREDLLYDAGYGFASINTIVSLLKGDEVIAVLDTDDYSWKRPDAGFDPIGATMAILETIADSLDKEQRGEA